MHRHLLRPLERIVPTIRELRAAIDGNVRVYGDIGKTNARASFYVRGLGYVSKFVRDFTYAPQVTRLLSELACDRLHPHSMTMNVGHTNIGEVIMRRKRKRRTEWRKTCVEGNTVDGNMACPCI